MVGSLKKQCSSEAERQQDVKEVGDGFPRESQSTVTEDFAAGDSVGGSRDHLPQERKRGGLVSLCGDSRFRQAGQVRL
jgi:hypothetical protein